MVDLIGPRTPFMQVIEQNNMGHPFRVLYSDDPFQSAFHLCMLSKQQQPPMAGVLNNSRTAGSTLGGPAVTTA